MLAKKLTPGNTCQNSPDVNRVLEFKFNETIAQTNSNYNDDFTIRDIIKTHKKGNSYEDPPMPRSNQSYSGAI